MVYVRVNIGRVTIIEESFPTETTIRKIKERIEGVTGIKVNKQKLSCNGQELENDHTLRRYALATETVRLDLDVVTRSTGAAPASSSAAAASSSSSDRQMLVTLKGYRRQDLYGLKPTTLASSLKRKLESEWGFFYENLRLEYNQQLMDDAFPLSHYNVTDGSVINVVIENNRTE